MPHKGKYTNLQSAAKYGDFADGQMILELFLSLASDLLLFNVCYFLIFGCDLSVLLSCMQKAKFDIGEEAVHRFSLPAEDKAMLELAEWVDGAFKRASV